MALNREALFSTLFDRLCLINGIVYKSRIFKTYDDLEASEQPALIMVKTSESVANQRGLPPIWTLQGTIFLYCRNDQDPYVGASVQLNQLITLVEAAFERQPNEYTIPNAPYQDMPSDYLTTLNGQCSHCWISGTIQTDEGMLGSQAAASIPFEIVATA
jgi:hypothetical protein